jgi:hypothetical protein
MLFVLGALLAIGLIGPATASAWAPAKTAPITPGVMTDTGGAQCTANFVFQDGDSVYLGQAAHCSGTGEATDTDGCTSKSLPLGTDVGINGSKPGKLVYNSWLTMQANGEADPDTCAYNDLALIKVDPADVDKVNPSIPRFGGPTGLGASAAATGDTVYSYGNSSLRQGIPYLSPKQGIVLQSEGNGWSRTVYTLTPGIPGDSGSGFLDANGKAIGVLSTLQLAPTPAGNGVGDLAKELDYLHSHTSFTGVHLVAGTEPFKPNLIGAVLGQ